MEVEDNVEDEDMDFNPFLREKTPSEASSSLTSENEESTTSSRMKLESSILGRQGDIEAGNANADENVQPQDRVPCGMGGNVGGFLENPSFELPQVNGTDASGMQAHCLSSAGNDGDPMIEVDDEDAICRRTRARYSLANYTLEELETFLQESEDEADIHNVDEQEEYRKFLSAVLLGEEDDVQARQGDENMDEDENDADFELEIEEALESDGDENMENSEFVDRQMEDDARRPETRQKRRLNDLVGVNEYRPGQARLPLRPILPYISGGQVGPGPACGWQLSPQKSFSSCSLALPVAELPNGFTDQQIAQLHVLIHEHVQLLIQVYSICVLEPSRQLTATDVQRMIVEMAATHEQALACRNVAYRASCFEPQHLCSSLDGSTKESREFQWVPLIANPVVSILDVAPLRLARSYLSDVTSAVLRYRRSHLDNPADKSHLRKEPLFPLPLFNTSTQENTHLPGECSPTSAASQLSPSQKQRKKSLAATLFENTKKEPVASVPVDIARLAQRFFPLFNFALFPRKPPIGVANRLLFTDAEDGLLAMGILEYNNDWEAIQRRFLPCKTDKQIFVRQKNQSSSRAEENPIKAVRRMKSSPLTIDEKMLINEGLKIFKNDWTSVWKFCVPHRDPSLLPRQWRVVSGTQKSYSKTEAEREKRRVYEAKRRKGVFGQEVDIDGADNDDGSYVHEAFLADSEKRSSNAASYELSLSSFGRKGTHPADLQIGMNAGEEAGHAADESGDPHNGQSAGPGQASGRTSCDIYSKKSASTSKSRPPVSCLVPQSSRICKGARVVKLAPDLPPVNLPPSVRVISQVEFQGHQNTSSYSNTSTNAASDIFPKFPHGFTENTSAVNLSRQLNLFPHHGSDAGLQQSLGTIANTTEENTNESDFQMHPLLFQYPQFSLYHHPMPYLVNVARKYDFFPCSRDQVEKGNDSVASLQKENPVDPNTIDFHPLLQKPDCVSGDRIRQPSANSSEREQDLDLNSHPCCPVDPTNAQQDCRDNILHQPEISFINLEQRMVEDSVGESSAQAEGSSEACTNHLEPETGNNWPHRSTGELNEESMQAIVMEQEELSDSDEDNEHVEFECEEMDDSDEEESQAARPLETQNEGISTFLALGEVQVSNEDSQRMVQQGSAQEGEHGASTEQRSQDSSRASLTQVKPKQDGLKRTRTRNNQTASASHSHESGRRRAKISRVQPGQPVTERRSTASRRPRKGPAFSLS